MEPSAARLNQTPVTVRLVRWVRPSAPCDRCAQPARPVWEAARAAIDIDLDRPVLLHVTVSVHHCRACRHYLRAQPPFLRPDATYTNRVVAKAVAPVCRDGRAITRVVQRLARDCWVRPSERQIRLWCRAYTDDLSLAGDYQQWVAAEFSGILCVDEVYQDRLAVLLAVDPAAPSGDRLVGYELVHGEVCQDDVRRFLERLRAAGIAPDQVITAGSPLYPAVLRTVWPSAAHQLCLFHETRLVLDAATQVIREVRKELPKPPPMQRPKGRFRKDPPPTSPEGDESYDRATRLALVHRLHREGYTQRAIARLTGHSRMTIRQWLREPAVAPEEPAREPTGPADTPGPVAEAAMPPTLPPAERSDTPTEPDWRARPALPPPPTPGRTWEEVQTAREDLRTYRFLLLRRPEHLGEAEQAQVDSLLDLPVGDRLRLARRFLEEWYAIAIDANGQRRTPEEAAQRWQAWRQNAAYRPLAPLRRVVDRLDAEHAERVLAFLQRPEWAATKNGAERGGRQFRHLQAACFKLRTDAAIDGALKAWATQTKEACTTRPAPASRSRRGRRGRQGTRHSHPEARHMAA